MKYRKIASLKTATDFKDTLSELGIELPFDESLQDGPKAPLAQSVTLSSGFKIGNRFAILPMEGWDGTPDGCPSETTKRRWRRFGMSGAKLIWGGEAVAVRHDGRANPNQLMIYENNLKDIAELRRNLVDEHRQHIGATENLFIGLQLTHSGRFARPNLKDKLEPKILYNHSVLNRKYGLQDQEPVFSDNEIKQLIDDFVHAAVLAQKAGFNFVDIKHCHGYLGHEFLSAMDRKGPFGGIFENRTRFLREIVSGIRTEAPDLEIGVRLSAFDWIPFKAGAENVGEPEPFPKECYCYAFGGDKSGVGIDLTEPRKFLELLSSLEIQLVCISAGSPYYNPHIQRPAFFPPSDGYFPTEDPLVGVARQIQVTAELKSEFPDLVIVGSAYSYLQEWLPNVAQNAVRYSKADFVGIGRMVLTYPEIVQDILAGNSLQRKRICRTFSDCTTAPRNGIVSGCFPLDEYYKKRPEAEKLKEVKKSVGL